MYVINRVSNEAVQSRGHWGSTAVAFTKRLTGNMGSACNEAVCHIGDIGSAVASTQMLIFA